MLARQHLPHASRAGHFLELGHEFGQCGGWLDDPVRVAEPRLRRDAAKRPQRVLDDDFLDREFGLMSIRLETWFPCAIPVYVNGHDWLARQMRRRKPGFVQLDSALTQLDHRQQTQQLAERFAQLNWVKQLSPSECVVRCV